MSGRIPFIAGNWKMNNTAAQAETLLDALLSQLSAPPCRVAVCVPFTALATAGKKLAGSPVLLGAQNLHQAEKGAYTGEVSAPMLVAAGAQVVIIGHSERRAYFAETDQTVNAKIKTALAHDLVPIVCVGESLEQRQAGQTDTLVAAQTLAALEGLTAAQVADVVFAYEPIWAIGTGQTATPEEANRVCALLRATVANAYGADTAARLCVQYGGSMNAQNCDQLMAQPDIDGGLIGGASLVAEDFARIVHHRPLA